MSPIYLHKLCVPQSAIDANGHVGNIEYLRWLLEAATAHAYATGGTQATQNAIEDGVYDLGNLNIENIPSSADHPIHIQARNIGGATLSSSKPRTLHIRNTPHLTLSGFHFDQISILVTNANHVRISQNTFHNTQDSVHWIDFHNASFGRVDHCDFGPRMTKGAYINVHRPSQHTQIDHNHFHDRPDLKRNGGQAIGLHGDHGHRWDIAALIEHNLFESCDGEHELFCVKSHQNIFRHNTFINCQGYISIRGGDHNKIYDHYFFYFGPHKPGSNVPAAARLQGLHNIVSNNYLFGLNTCISAQFGDTLVPYISPEDRKTWWQTHTNTHSYALGIHEVAYRTSKNNAIIHNTAINCQHLFHWIIKGLKKELPPHKEPHRRTRKSQYPPEAWLVANNLTVNLCNFISEHTQRLEKADRPPPAYERDFTWIGNILSSANHSFGEARFLNESEFKPHNIQLHASTPQGLYNTLPPIPATPYPTPPAEHERHNPDLLYPKHPHAGCHLHHPPLKPDQVGPAAITNP